MQNLLHSATCCCRREQPDVLDDGGGITGSYWSIWQSREQFKPHDEGTLSTIVTTEPSVSTTPTRNIANDLVDFEFPEGSYEDVRYGDMSATIFKRQQHT